MRPPPAGLARRPCGGGEPRPTRQQARSPRAHSRRHRRQAGAARRHAALLVEVLPALRATAIRAARTHAGRRTGSDLIRGGPASQSRDQPESRGSRRQAGSGVGDPPTPIVTSIAGERHPAHTGYRAVAQRSLVACRSASAGGSNADTGRDSAGTPWSCDDSGAGRARPAICASHCSGLRAAGHRQPEQVETMSQHRRVAAARSDRAAAPPGPAAIDRAPWSAAGPAASGPPARISARQQPGFAPHNRRAASRPGCRAGRARACSKRRHHARAQRIAGEPGVGVARVFDPLEALRARARSEPGAADVEQRPQQQHAGARRLAARMPASAARAGARAPAAAAPSRPGRRRGAR